MGDTIQIIYTTGDVNEKYYLVEETNDDMVSLLLEGVNKPDSNIKLVVNKDYKGDKYVLIPVKDKNAHFIISYNNIDVKGICMRCGKESIYCDSHLYCKKCFLDDYRKQFIGMSKIMHNLIKK